MAIGFRAAGTFATRGSPSTSPLSVGIPAGTASGDLMLLAASSYNNPGGNVAVTTPTGWTLIDSRSAWLGDYRSYLFYKVAGSSESAASVNTAASAYLDAVTVGFTGVDATTPIDVAGTWAAESSSATVTVPSITTLTANAWWVFFTADTVGQLNSSSVPSGWTQRALTSITIMKYAISSVPVVAAGATSATSFSRTGSSAAQVSIGIALRESGASPGGGATFVPQVVIL